MSLRWAVWVAGVVGLCQGLSGCSRIEQAWMPVPDKVNAAFPVEPEVQVAQSQLLTLVGDQPEQVRVLKAQLAARMTLRALNCSKDRTISRLASLDDVRALHLDRACFQEQDKAMKDMLGARAVGLLLALPASQPLKTLGAFQALPVGDTQGFRAVTAAAQANVVAVMGGDAVVRVVSVPDGKPLSTISGIVGSYAGDLSLSPNGRLLSVHKEGKVVVFFDTSTGRKLWELGNVDRLVAWLPEVQGLILQSSRDGWMLVDADRGEIKPHPLNVRSRPYTLTVSSSPSRMLAVGAHELELVEHKREPEGITASMAQQYTLGQDAPFISATPVLMRKGKLMAYGSGDNIGWLDLESGRSGKWGPLSPVRGGLARLDDTHVLFEMIEPGAGNNRNWVFDIAAGTLAPVVTEEAHRGNLNSLSGRDGALIWGGSQLWVGGQASTGPSVALDAFVAEANLKIQLTKLEQAAAQERAAAEEEAQARAMARDGLPEVPSNAAVHVMGVYEAKGPVRVTVRGTGRPVVLVLASYETVNWVVSDPERKVAAVLLSGYKPSTVDVSGGARRVLRIGSAYAYEAGSREHKELLKAVRQYSGNREIRSFQGGYHGAEFSVGP